MKIKYLKKGVSFVLLNTIAIPCVLAQTPKTDTVVLNKKEEQKVNIAFGIQPKKYVTSALSTLSGTDLEKNFTLNLGNTLYGRVSGLTVAQGNSEPGAGVPSLFLRGINNLGGGASRDPLYVIDGYIANGTGAASAFMQLLPEEIESITFLKDASATAVYGGRAANGAILVTTKRGQEGALKITFGSKLGFNQAQYIPKFLHSYNYAVLFNEALKNDGLGPKYSDADLYAYQNHTDPLLHPDVNWYNEVLRPTAPVSSYDLTLSGGDKTVHYFALLNVLNAQGLFKKFGDQTDQSSNSGFARYNFRSNVDIILNQRLTAEFKIAGSIETIKNPAGYNTSVTFGNLATLAPNAFPVNIPNGSVDVTGTPIPDGSFAGTSAFSNPVGNLLSTGFSQSNARTILSSLKLTQQLDMITPGLSVSGAVSINNYFKSGSRKTKNYIYYTPSLSSTGNVVYTQVASSTSTSLAGTEETLDQYRNLIIQAFLNYNRKFGKHDISAMAMFNTDQIVVFGPASDPSNPTANSTDPYKHNAGSGRITYAYNNKYVAEVSASYMGTEIFAPGKQYGFFPAASVGWIVSNESFMKKMKAIQFLKLRASYGLVGNDIIATQGLSTRYAYMAGFGGGTYYFGTANTAAGGYAESTISNPNITWEKEKHMNLGFDATLFKNFEVSFDYFKRERYDILVASNSATPGFLGVTTPSLNQGKTEDKGFDLSLRYRKEYKKGFSFFVETNLSYFVNKVVFNAEALQINQQLYATGKRIGQPFGLTAIGFYTPDDIAKRAVDPKSVPGVLTEPIQAGDIKYKDIGGPNGVPDGIIDGNDAGPIGNPSTPNWTLGLHTGFNYKGFDLDLVFQAVTGNTVTLSGTYFYAFQNNGQIAPIALNRWTPATAETADYPRLSSKNNLNNYQFSSFWQRDASFIKLRSAEIGYTIPAKILAKVKINSSRVFVNGTNLFSLDRIKYGDPESLTGYPVTRTITFGFKIQL